MTATLDFCMPCGVFSALFEQRRTTQPHAGMEDEPTVLLP
jgi:hypothetical protein